MWWYCLWQVEYVQHCLQVLEIKIPIEQCHTLSDRVCTAYTAKQIHSWSCGCGQQIGGQSIDMLKWAKLLWTHYSDPPGVQYDIACKSMACHQTCFNRLRAFIIVWQLHYRPCKLLSQSRAHWKGCTYVSRAMYTCTTHICRPPSKPAAATLYPHPTLTINNKHVDGIL